MKNMQHYVFSNFVISEVPISVLCHPCAIVCIDDSIRSAGIHHREPVFYNVYHANRGYGLIEIGYPLWAAIEEAEVWCEVYETFSKMDNIAP